MWKGHVVTLDRTSPAALWKQLVDGVVGLVDGGVLSAGDRLPPTRVLAAELGVNRSTVCRAYEELWALGYLESRPGSYSTVRGRARPLMTGPRTGPSLIDWDSVSAPGALLAYRALAAAPKAVRAGAGWVDFASLTADPDLCPADDFRRAVRHVLLEGGASLLDYGDPAGFAPLRETLARRMRAHGISVGSDEILITQGAQQALDLIVRLLARPGAGIVLEAPTYGLIIPLQRLYGLRPLEVAMRADGMDLDALERCLERARPALVYTVPNFQNPTGVTTSQAHRERLLALCEARRVPIVEDGFEEEMKYFGRAVLPLKSMDTRGLVIYVGTFSKVVFPGLRVGWVAADPECVRRLAALNRFGMLSGNTLAPAAVNRFCQAGRYDAYLRRVHARFRRRLTMLLRSLEVHGRPCGLEWTVPAGGCTLWVRVQGLGADAEPALLDCASAERVALAPGSLFFSTPPEGLFCRLSIARAKVHEIDEGCRRLARAISRLRAGQTRRDDPASRARRRRARQAVASGRAPS